MVEHKKERVKLFIDLNQFDKNFLSVEFKDLLRLVNRRNFQIARGIY